ncbi:MAG: LysR family transcriptional regulator [Rhodoferax sp.]|nr:LysR family transcriptional regulator [Rhodoferax sp.]
MSTPFNYKHLYYFWVVAKEGGISRAAEKLDMAVQTVSAQVRELERSLGYALLKPAGRGLVLTDAGMAAMQQADHIFQLGEALPALVRDAVSALLKTFGASGMGVFPAAEWAHDDLLAHCAVSRLGPCEGVTEHFFAIGTEKKVQHPLVLRLLQPAL